LRHVGETHVAALRQNRSIEVAHVTLGLRLVAARVREVAREANLRVGFDQEARDVEAREARFDPLP
jgi:hypothetical protein